MGIYLSAPKTEKVSEDGENDRLRYGLSSMQGWRATMEDAVSSSLSLLFICFKFFIIIFFGLLLWFIALADRYVCLIRLDDLSTELK